MWLLLGKKSHLTQEKLSKVRVGGRSVAIAANGGNLFAFDSHCPHKGGPLDQGDLVGETIQCPWHGYKFDVSTGKVVLIPYPPSYGAWRETGNLKLFDLKMEGEDVYADV